jgi:hypothetical protein
MALPAYLLGWLVVAMFHGMPTVNDSTVFFNLELVSKASLQRKGLISSSASGAARSPNCVTAAVQPLS